MSLITIGYSDSKKDYTGMQVPKPKFGDQLRNGAIVIAYKHISNGGANWYPHGIVLARKRHGIGEFVTWTCIYDVNQDYWFCEGGRYAQDIVEAAKDYEKRF